MFIKLATVLVAAAAFVSQAQAAPTMELEARQSYSGDGTYYAPGLGACGFQSIASELVVAVSHELYDTYPGHTTNPNNNPICRRRLQATYQGKSVTVTVVDRCAGCNGRYDLDFSPAAFSRLAPQSVGRIRPVTWHWV